MAYQLSNPLAHCQSRRMLGPDVRTTRLTPHFVTKDIGGAAPAFHSTSRADARGRG